MADAAAAAIMPHFRAATAVENKGADHFDPVTIADRAAEEAMRALISAEFPNHGIIGEEFGNDRPDAEFVWVLDPIDGTRAFISGLPLWGVLIGLKRDGVPILGMMAQPFTGERFAGDGQRAWYKGPPRDAPLKTRRCAALSDATLLSTTPAMFKGDDRSAYDRLERQVRMPRFGTDCYGYCMVAAGHVDIVVEASLKPYDIVALIPIVEGAGGRVTDWQGGSAANGGRIVASGDRNLHERVLETLTTPG